MLFPKLSLASSCAINLDDEAKLWPVQQPKSKSNPLLDPVVCETFISECHKKYGVNFSFGGWLENRSTLWRGSYLDDGAKYIHLGVDFNVPAGTSVATDREYTILRIDDDYPEAHGWGKRIFLKEMDADVIAIFAHIEPESIITVGKTIQQGTIIGTVGSPPFNGNWYPHLHMQVVDETYYEELLKNDLRDLDGYGMEADLEVLIQHFHDPMRFITL